MTELVFRKAERKKAKARIALCAPAGGGKTHSSLLIAKGLGGTIALIDTENASAQLEAGKTGIPAFDVLTLEAPYEPKKYIEAIHLAEEAGYDTIIIDSLSHAWAGSGGLLDKQAKISMTSGNNSYTAWRFVTPDHNALVDAILQSKCHIIGTMRSKVEYALQENDKGRMQPVKMGLAPIQREGMDYEFTIVFDISVDKHLATCSKDRTSLFQDTVSVIGEETGKKIKEWLEEGKAECPTEEQTAEYKKQLEALGMTQKDWEKAVKKKWENMTIKEAGEWVKKNQYKIDSRKEVEAQ